MTLHRGALLSVGLLAGASLLLESTLLRLLAIAQYYHFAFLVISLALLGIGASGSFLSLRPPQGGRGRLSTVRYACLGFALSVGLAYLAVNLVPFDSYSIAWDVRQLLFFGIYYIALALPFFFGGLGVGAALAGSGRESHLVYAANLAGSGLGALLAPIAIGSGGVPGAILVSGLAGLIAAAPIASRRLRWGIVGVVAIGLGFFATLDVLNLNGSAPLGMTLSPYKGLSNSLRYPGAKRLYSRWNAVSRVDLIANAGTRQLPGLSYSYSGSLPEQLGLSVDGDAPQAITLADSISFDPGEYLPEALAFQLIPKGHALVLEPGGGMGILQALAGGAEAVTVVESNPLLSATMNQVLPSANPYQDPRVRAIHTPVRPYLTAPGEQFDIVFFPLTDRYLPVSSGAFSLRETYNLTVESYRAALKRLEPGGILVATRWLQTPPSESLRLVSTLAAALDEQDIPAERSLIVYRGVQTATALVRPDGWSAKDLAAVRDFLASRRFDLVWAPDIQPTEANRFNRFPSPDHYLTISALLQGENRTGFLASYPFDVHPASDDHPFFFHFFRWEQTPEVLATLGMTWQPFGGSGYFLLFALLLLVLAMSTLLILIPILASRRGPALLPPVPAGEQIRLLIYFAALGIAFLFIEIPLIQRWILYLGHASYAFVAVVPALLLFSGLGSLIARSEWVPRRLFFLLLVGLALVVAFILPAWLAAALGWPLWGRILITSLSLAPLGFLMGLPFPWGLIWLEQRAPGLVAWAWAVNGCASVVSAVLAAILSLSYGFTAVIALGGLAYAGALAVYWRRASGKSDTAAEKWVPSGRQDPGREAPGEWRAIGVQTAETVPSLSQAPADLTCG